jgi:Glyoxalase-like domain
MHEHLDHIIWACSDLEQGTRRFEELTGIRPRFGGVHTGGLTHNALVAIGPRCYLEILAPTGAARAEDDSWCRMARGAREPRLLTYCLRGPRPLTEIAALGRRQGWRDSVVADNGRRTPDGVELRWQWIAPKIDRFALAFPFFIDWLDSPHPAGSLRAADPDASIRLRQFGVGHPLAAELHETLAQLGSLVDTWAAESLEFRVELDTPRGAVAL